MLYCVIFDGGVTMAFNESNNKSVYWRYVSGALDAADGVDQPSADERSVLDSLVDKIKSGKYGAPEVLYDYLLHNLRYLSGIFDSNADARRKYSEVIDLRGAVHNRLNPMSNKDIESHAAQIEQSFISCLSILFQIHAEVYDSAWTADLENPDQDAKKRKIGDVR